MILFGKVSWDCSAENAGFDVKAAETPSPTSKTPRFSSKTSDTDRLLLHAMKLSETVQQRVRGQSSSDNTQKTVTWRLSLWDANFYVCFTSFRRKYCAFVCLRGNYRKYQREKEICRALPRGSCSAKTAGTALNVDPDNPIMTAGIESNVIVSALINVLHYLKIPATVTK
jgi:hypothetical protein